jgi:uncharacterized protein
LCQIARVKPLNFLKEGLFVGETDGRGRGMFSKLSIEAGEIIEIAPVIVLSKKDRSFIDQTLLHDYIFEWGNNKEKCCMALGYVPLYNHAYKSNCEYEMQFNRQIITIKTVRDIFPGEELFINYNGDFDDDKPLWFSAK